MKYTCSFICIILFWLCVLTSAMSLNFSAPINVSNNANSTDIIDTMSVIAVDRFGIVHIAWMGTLPSPDYSPDGVVTDVFYANNKGGNFCAPIRIETPPTLLFSMSTSFQTDLDNATLSNDIITEFSNHGIHLWSDATIRIIEEGNKWQIKNSISAIYDIKKENGMLNVCFGRYYSKDISIAVDRLGTAHIAYERSFEQVSVDWTDAIYYVNNAGGSFGKPMLLVNGNSGGEGTGGPGDPSIGVDGAGNVHISYDTFFNGLYYINNIGGDFSIPINVSGNMDGKLPRLKTDQYDKVHIVYEGDNPSANDIEICYVNNVGGIFCAPINISNDSVNNQQRPTMAIDKNNYVHIAYQNGDGVNTLSYVNNVSGTFGVPIVAVPYGSIPTRPSLDIDSHGNIHIAYSKIGAWDLGYANNIGGNFHSMSFMEVEAFDEIVKPSLSCWFDIDNSDRLHFTFYYWGLKWPEIYYILGVHEFRIASGPSGTPNPVASGGTVQCNVTATDSWEDPITYSWTATGGSFANAKIQNPVWTAPANNSGSIVNYTLTVTATCAGGTTDTKSYQQGVKALPNAPVTVNDSYSINEDNPLTVVAPGVLTNDTDADGDPLTAIKVSDPVHGTLTLSANGSFIYTPSAGYIGSDSFTYKANDGVLDSNVATVSLMILPAFVVTSPIGTVEASVAVPFSMNISIPSITGATLYYKKGGAGSYTGIVLSQAGIAWSGSIPAVDVTVRGLLYYVDAVDGAAVHHLYGSASTPFFIPVHGSTSMVFNTTPPAAPNVWNMLAPSVAPDNTAISNTFGPGYGTSWIAWRWNPITNQWEVPALFNASPASADSFESSKGWFFAEDGDGGPASALCDGTSVDPSTGYAIDLSQGWNIIANPFSFPVSWADSVLKVRYLGNDYTPTEAEANNLVDNRAIWYDSVTGAYETRYSNVSPYFTMLPTRAQWLYSAVDGAQLVISPTSTTPAPPATPQKDTSAWKVVLSLQSSVGKDSVEAIVGKASGTSSIALSQVKPPTIPFASLYIALTREDHRVQLLSDIQPAADVITWSFEATATSETMLNWDILNVPSDYSLSLTDVNTGRTVVDLRQDSALRLSVGVHRFILKAEKKALIPKATKLLVNYPNPFNPETWIPYELSKDTDVAIKIYASNGQLVRSLELGHKMAGFYSSKDKAAYWDGKNEAGERVSSGVYFYNIQAGNYHSTMKMIISK